MPAEWRISHFPLCEHHVFLSHCAEDRDDLVVPLHRALVESGVTTWIDRHDYALGRNAFEVLREEILRCRHVVFLVTRSMLRQGRAWTAVELAHASLLQQRLRHRDVELAHCLLPLFLVPRDDPVLARSAWNVIRERGEFFTGSDRAKVRRAGWCADRIVAFVENEERWGQAIGERLQRDPDLKSFLEEPHLLRRIIAADPPHVRQAPS
jgi:hypothetical protein